MPKPPDRDILQEWRESAPFWEKHAASIRSMFAPITTALIERAGIDRGCLVLDVAGGSGEPSLTVAEVVKPSGSVVFTDAVHRMVLTSKTDALDRKLTNIDFAQCAAEALPFKTDTFDVVVCRLGVMLFRDPAVAAAEALRVIKPSGRVAFAVWHTNSSNPFFSVAANVVSRYVDATPEDPNSPGAFRFAERGKLAGMLTEAGAVEVSERLFKFTISSTFTPRQYWELRSELSDTLRAKLATLLPEQLANIARDVEEAAREYYDEGQMRFPTEVLIVSGRKSDVLA